MTIILRSQVQEATVNNLVSAGILEQGETESYYEILSAMDYRDVIGALLESNELVENLIKPISYYHIGEISKN